MGRSESPSEPVLLSRVSGVSGVSIRRSSRLTGLSELAGLFWAAEVLEESKASDLSGPLQQTAGTANNRVSAPPPTTTTFGTSKLEFQSCVSAIETEMEAFC